MKNYKCRYINHRHRGGFALVFVVVMMVVLMLIGTALLTITYGMRLRAIKLKDQTVAMLAAEAGYEKGIYWMNAVPDVLTGLSTGNPPGFTPADLTSSGTFNFADSSCTYSVQFYDYIGGVPVFRVVSTGTCGGQKRVVDVYVKQAVTGWDMGLCRVPKVGIACSTPISYSSTDSVNFTDGEIVDMTLHINKNDTNPASEKDIYFYPDSAKPRFLRQVQMGESQYNGGNDKYATVMSCFEGGIIFDQPDSRITDKATVNGKLARFKSSTKTQYIFTPKATANVTGLPSTCSLLPAVQMEFYNGNVRIRNNCTVVGYSRSTTHDYWIDGNGNFCPYPIYAYHYHDDTGEIPQVVSIADTYVSQTFPGTGKVSDPSGQIYVDGNVILGSDAYEQLVVGGKLTIVATGNIWIAGSIYVAGTHDASGMPTTDNGNALGLIAGGVIKVIDPGMSLYGDHNAYGTGSSNYYPTTPTLPPDGIPDRIINGKKHKYMPVAHFVGAPLNNRVLYNQRNAVNTVDPTDSTVVEAAITVGGGGWGAENVKVDNTYGGRRENNESVPAPSGSTEQDPLIVRGTFCEVVRGIVGTVGNDGYLKNYHLDKRLLEGVLPGNIWFSGKFDPAPAGWHDYSPN
jgi:type II secretory pathway pseudopilin PulG